ncbi:uncharacterized protein LOC144650067 isoform X1 [Oculina patagonica]
MLSELEELDKSRAWPRLFQRLNWEASQKAGALTAARLPENRQLNRYRDVLPYDHSRIILKEGSPDFINANLVEITRLNKKYILTQGPLPHTAKHFWQMIWEQNSEAVIMLNRVIEKNQIKCYQYWPCGEAYGHVNHLEFGDFRIYYLRELRNEYFTIRSLELENMLTGERRPIDHFHYLTWPDFGVPTSPATFLAFLFEVRKSGVMSADAGPCVIHCSAGIGRSGTFVMVDSVLTEVEHVGDLNQIDIKAMLLEIRQYRVGLIQTPDQLRFTYLAILEGVRVLMPEIYQREKNHHFHLQTNSESRDQDSKTAEVKRNKEEHKNAEEEDETPPPLPPRRRLEATDEPVTKKSRTSDHGMSKTKHITKKMETNKNKSKMMHLFRVVARGRKRQKDDTAARQSSEGTGRLEPEAEKEVFSDDSEGSDEIIDLSSLSDSEPDDESVPEEDLNNEVVEETRLGNDNLKQTEKGLQPTDEEPQHTEEGLQTKDGRPQPKEEGLQTTGGGPSPKEEGLQPSDEGCHHSEEGLQSTDKGCHHSEEGLQPADKGCQHTEEGLRSTDEGCQDTKEGLRSTDEGCQDTTESTLQSRDEWCKITTEGLQSRDEGCKHTEEGIQPTNDGGVNKKDSITQIRKRRREERKQKITDLVENIKKNVKREEDAKVWKSRLKNTLMVVAVCSVAYITFRYFTSG